MSKYHDDTTYASDPGGVHLSLSKLKELEPALLTERTFKCSPTCDKDHPAAEMRERFDEHLRLGDSRAAVVISTNPLLVGAYSSDLDAAVLLRFPLSFVVKYGLSVGSRLLTVNTYEEMRDAKTGDRWYAVDLIPGPARTGWSNVSPFIADFLSDDADRIEARKRAISEDEWRTAQERANLRLSLLGPESARDGKPSVAGTPVRLRGTPYFLPFEVVSAEGSVNYLKVASRVGQMILLFFLFLFLAVLGLLWHFLH